MMNSLLIPFLLELIVLAKDPKFEAQVIDDKVSIGYGLAVGDVDGDGKPDILLADKKEFVWYRNGDWKRFVMVANLTEADNVCIAARDIDGDGRVEVAVGAQWNPGETSDPEKSGSVHYLIRPDDPTQRWTPVKLHHEPTVHRMHWVKAGDKYQLIVLPLHGRGNKDGEGNGVKVKAYDVPQNPNGQWKHEFIDESMHLTHNFDPVVHGNGERMYIGGKEGIKVVDFQRGKWIDSGWAVKGKGVGEVRLGNITATDPFLAAIEPMHGNQLTVYTGKDFGSRSVLSDDLKQGHAVATGDLLDLGHDQIVAGWREANSESKIGVKIFVAQDKEGSLWKDYWIDDNGMACEDLKVADLDGDGKPDIVAAGRSTHNLKVYWNKN